MSGPLHAECDPVAALEAIRAQPDHEAAADYIYRCVGLEAIRALRVLAFDREAEIARMGTSIESCLRLAEALRDERVWARGHLEAAAARGDAAARRTIARLDRMTKGAKP